MGDDDISALLDGKSKDGKVAEAGDSVRSSSSPDITKGFVAHWSSPSPVASLFSDSEGFSSVAAASAACCF